MPPPTRRQFLAGSAGLSAGLLARHGVAQPGANLAPTGEMVTPAAQSAIDRGLAFLANAQAADGSFPDARSPFALGNVAVTGLAGLALMAGGHQPGRGRYGKAVARAADYVVARGSSADPRTPGFLANTDQLPGGGLNQRAMYEHGFGALFLSEVAGRVPDRAKQDRLRATLERAVGLTRRAQNNEGGWRYSPEPVQPADVSVTVAQLMALRAAKNAGVTVPKAVIDKCVRYIKDCQLADGGFCYFRGQPGVGSQFARSAAAVVGLFSAGVYTGPEIERGLRYLMRSLPGGRGFEAHLEHYFYAHYYAGLAMWTAGGTYWAEWFPAAREELLGKARAAGGVWDDQPESGHGRAYATAMACIVLQLPNNYLPIMQK